jgi:hypothetical protein
MVTDGLGKHHSTVGLICLTCVRQRAVTCVSNPDKFASGPGKGLVAADYLADLVDWQLTVCHEGLHRIDLRGGYH